MNDLQVLSSQRVDCIDTSRSPSEPLESAAKRRKANHGDRSTYSPQSVTVAGSNPACTESDASFRVDSTAFHRQRAYLEQALHHSSELASIEGRETSSCPLNQSASQTLQLQVGLSTKHLRLPGIFRHNGLL